MRRRDRSHRGAPAGDPGRHGRHRHHAPTCSEWSPRDPSTTGCVTAFVRGSTAAITTMEFEPGGVADLRDLLDRLVPVEGDYEHNRLNHDTNSHAHQRASLIGSSEQVPVIDGRLALGTWQQLVLIDFDDRPRDRTVVVQVIS